MAKFYKFPFAVGGDKAAIPDPTQVSGSMSYTQGYPVNYQLDQNSNPSALDIDRQQFNQLMYDATLALQQYQTFGFPDFISTSDNGGTPYSYDKYAIIRYTDGKIYQSLVNSNTALPTDITAWVWLDLSTQGNAVIFSGAVFDTGVVNKDVVYWNNSITKFAKAQANGTGTQQAVGIADVTNSRVYLSGLVPNMTGLTPGSVYFLSPSSAGALTAAQPTSNIVRLGIAKSTTELFLSPIFLTGFDASFSSPGYIKLPNGGIFQFGLGTTGASGTGKLDVVFPIAWPNACLNLVANITAVVSAPSPYTIATSTPTTTGFTAYSTGTASSTLIDNIVFFWNAIGS